jgi:hypothetical protein
MEREQYGKGSFKGDSCINLGIATMSRDEIIGVVYLKRKRKSFYYLI